MLFFFVACSREGENYWTHSIEWFCNTYFGRLACTFCRECIVELPVNKDFQGSSAPGSC